MRFKFLKIFFALTVTFVLYFTLWRLSCQKDNLLLESGLDYAESENIFFVETGESTRKVTLTPRQACSIESAALKNPLSRVSLLYTTRRRFQKLQETAAVTAIRSYSNVNINYINTIQLATGSPMEDFYKSNKLATSKFKISHASDALRLLLLWKFGGTYLDTDMIVRKQLNSIPPNFACPESDETMNGAILNFDLKQGRNLSEIFIQAFLKNFDGKIYAQNGPELITKVVKTLFNVNKISDINVTEQHGFHVLKKEVCYPVHHYQWQDLMTEDNTEEVMAKVNDSLVIHFWNQFTKKVQLKTSSKAPYILLGFEFCPKVMASCNGFF